MKNLVMIILFCVSFTADAQNNKLPEAKIPPPEYFIDSVKISDTSPYLTYMNPNEIADIQVSKDQSYPNGAIFVTLKDHRKLAEILRDKLLSITDIAKANVPAYAKHKPIIYLIDEKLLTDTAGIRIPSMYLRKATLIKAEETAYFRTALPNVLILKIITKPPVLMLRGQVAAR